MRLKISLLFTLLFAVLVFAGRPASAPAPLPPADENARLLQSLEHDLASEKLAISRIQRDLDEEKRRLALLQQRAATLRGRLGISAPAPAPRANDPLTPTY